MDRDQDRLVVEAVRASGFDITSVWNLVHTRDDYAEAVPALVAMLPRVSDYGVKEGIVRALTLKKYRAQAFDAIVDALEDLFDDESQRADSLKWVIGNALSVLASKEDGETLTALLRRREAGGARQMIAWAMGRIKYRPAVPFLIQLLDDGEVAGHAASALGRMNAQEAREALAGLSLNAATPYAKREAAKAVERLARR